MAVTIKLSKADAILLADVLRNVDKFMQSDVDGTIKAMLSSGGPFANTAQWCRSARGVVEFAYGAASDN